MSLSCDVAAQKRALRKELLSVLHTLSAETRSAADQRIRALVTDMPQFRRARRLFIFVGVGWEVDTWPLIQTALSEGKMVAVPRCLPLRAESGAVMEACLIRGRDDLRQVPPLGLWEPAEGTATLTPASIDFALIPCIACDTAGRRLGKGAGYYDRFLSGEGFPKVAVCRKAVLRDRLPVETFDEKIDFVITESGMIDCRRGEDQL